MTKTLDSVAANFTVGLGIGRSENYYCSSSRSLEMGGVMAGWRRIIFPLNTMAKSGVA